MSQKARDDDTSEMRPEYDFSKGVRGKYVDAYRQGTNVVVLEPDVAKAFPTSESVNDALRRLMESSKSGDK